MNLLKRKNKTIVAVFAHPDDEAFGPAGTLAKLSQDNNVYIICATRGDANKDKKIGQIRSRELEKSAKILGIKRVYFLGFSDGSLSNSLYHKLANEIESILKKIKPETLITFEPRGISGHIDHITLSMVTTYLFEKLSWVKKLLYYCISNQARNMIKDYFIYFPPGYKNSEIDLVVNIEKFWSKKVEAMKCHKSQARDAKRILKMQKKLPKEEYFQVLSKIQTTLLEGV